MTVGIGPPDIEPLSNGSRPRTLPVLGSCGYVASVTSGSSGARLGVTISSGRAASALDDFTQPCVVVRSLPRRREMGHRQGHGPTAAADNPWPCFINQCSGSLNYVALRPCTPAWAGAAWDLNHGVEFAFVAALPSSTVFFHNNKRAEVYLPDGPKFLANSRCRFFQ